MASRSCKARVVQQAPVEGANFCRSFNVYIDNAVGLDYYETHKERCAVLPSHRNDYLALADLVHHPGPTAISRIILLSVSKDNNYLRLSVCSYNSYDASGVRSCLTK